MDCFSGEDSQSEDRDQSSAVDNRQGTEKAEMNYLPALIR
jgi:hypothetical protein